MWFIMSIIVYVFNFKKLYNDIGAKGVKNHKPDQLLTQGELLFLLGAVREKERVFHPLTSLPVRGFPLGIQTSRSQPLVSGCCFQGSPTSRFLPTPPLHGSRCEMPFSVALNHKRKLQVFQKGRCWIYQKRDLTARLLVKWRILEVQFIFDSF